MPKVIRNTNKTNNSKVMFIPGAYDLISNLFISYGVSYLDRSDENSLLAYDYQAFDLDDLDLWLCDPLDLHPYA